MIRLRVRAAAAAAALLMVVGCGFSRDPEPVAQGASPVSGSPAETVEPTYPEPAPEEASPATEPAPTSKPAPPPTVNPEDFPLPDCARTQGKPVSKKAAKAALTKAAGRKYWPAKAPELKVPQELVEVIAWQETRWLSNVVNCNGGRGLMGVQPETVDMINQRFGESYDADNHRQSAEAGANYLAWLTKAFGETYFRNTYDLSPKKCRTTGSMCLLNMVISGYNAGRGEVDAAYASGRLPNQAYVDSVRSLMKTCYCDRY